MQYRVIQTGGMIKFLSFHFFCKYEIKIGQAIIEA